MQLFNWSLAFEAGQHRLMLRAARGRGEAMECTNPGEVTQESQDSEGSGSSRWGYP
jgi:hypothetical protein